MTLLVFVEEIRKYVPLSNSVLQMLLRLFRVFCRVLPCSLPSDAQPRMSYGSMTTREFKELA